MGRILTGRTKEDTRAIRERWPFDECDGCVVKDVECDACVPGDKRDPVEKFVRSEFPVLIPLCEGISRDEFIRSI